MRARLLLPLLLTAACGGDSAPTGTGTSATPPWTTGQAAEAVLGGPSVSGIGTGGVTQTSLYGPWGLAVQSDGTLWVHDNSANRILRFNGAPTKANGAAADGVLGQANFTGSTWNGGAGGSTAVPNGYNASLGIAVDATGALYVADAGNTRVLRFNAAASKANGASADGVYGQPNLTTNSSGATTATGYFAVQGVAADANGRLWVADGSNHRVLRYDNAAAKANGAAADGVLGQASFTTGAPGTTASTMRTPTSVVVDAAGNLYVGERGNGRVLIFKNAASKANGAAADVVLGQPDFVTGTTPVTGTQANIYLPYGLAVDGKGNLYVADGGFNRVLVFYNAANKANGANADVVLGKATFSDVTTTAASAANVGQPYGVAVHSATGKLWITDYANGRVLRFQAAAALQ